MNSRHPDQEILWRIQRTIVQYWDDDAKQWFQREDTSQFSETLYPEQPDAASITGDPTAQAVESVYLKEPQ